MTAFKNVFACPVHEKPDCVVDLVRNLHCLDPESPILLYDGGALGDFLSGIRFPFADHNAFIHPSPRPVKWAKLHEFALESMRWAAGQGSFDAITFVDSDQLLLRPGYTRALAEFAASRPKLGLLGSTDRLESDRARRSRPALVAWREVALWRPLLRRFRDGEATFVQFSFWPSTVFTADACRDLLALWDGDERLRDVVARSGIWPTEEIILPTLIALLGYDIVLSPFRSTFVRYRTGFSLPVLERALRTPNAFWMHPVPRRLDDPLRSRIRERFRDYADASAFLAAEPEPSAQASLPPIRSRHETTARTPAQSRARTPPHDAARAVSPPKSRPSGEPTFVAFGGAPSRGGKPAGRVRLYAAASADQRATHPGPPFGELVSPAGRCPHAEGAVTIVRKRRHEWRDGDYVGVFDSVAWRRSGWSLDELGVALGRSRSAHAVYLLSRPARSSIFRVASSAHVLGERIARHVLHERLRLPERILTRELPLPDGGLWLAQPEVFERYVLEWLVPARAALDDRSDAALQRLLAERSRRTETPLGGGGRGNSVAIDSLLLGCLAPAFFSYLACRFAFLAPSSEGTQARYASSRSVASR